MHVFARAWMIATNQTDNAYDFNYQVVDVIHMYVQGLVFSLSEKICYRVTKTEKENNDFSVTVPFAQQNTSPEVLM